MRISPLNLATVQNQTQVKQNSNIKTNIPTNLSYDKFSRNISFGKEFSLEDNVLDYAIKDEEYPQRIEKVIKGVQAYYRRTGAPEELKKMLRKTNETVEDIYIRKNENSKYINFKDLTITANKKGQSFGSDVCFHSDTSGVKFDLEFLHAKDLGDYIRTCDIKRLFCSYADARAKSEAAQLFEALMTAGPNGSWTFSLLSMMKDAKNNKKVYIACELALQRNASQEKYDKIKEQLCKDYSDFLVEYMGISLEELEEENPDVIAKFITRNFNLDARRGDLYIETYGKYKLTKGEMSEEEVDQLNEIIPPDIRTLAFAMPNIKKASDELCELDYRANGRTGMVLGNYKQYIPEERDIFEKKEWTDLDEWQFILDTT